MTTELTTTPARGAVLSTKNKAGLALAVLLGLADIASVFATPEPAAGEAGPPMGILIISAVLGVVTIAAAAFAWRTGNRVGSRVVAGTRILSALGALPAFFVEGVPAGLVATAGIGVVVTIVAVWLVLSPPRS